MPDQAYVFRTCQIAKETTSGTQVTPSKTLGSLEIAPSYDPTVNTFGPMGNLLTTVAATNYEETKLALKGIGTYDELPYALAGLINDVSPTTPGGGTAKLWTFTLNDTSANTPATFTYEVGDTIRAARGGYMLFTEGAWSIDLDKGMQFTGAAIGQKMADDKYRYLRTTGTPTGGTITITATQASAVTTAIAYNAASATVQTALRALPTINATGVTVSGSAGGPYTVTFAGELATKAVPMITLETNSLTGGTNPTVGFVETTPGVDGTTSEVQTLTISGIPTGGTFVLGFKTNSTTLPAIAYNAAASTIQTAILAMPLFASGDVTASGGPLPATVTLAFAGAVAATELPVLTISNALTGGTSPTATLTRMAPGTTTPALVPVLGSQYNFYGASTMAGLATATALLRVFNYQIKLSGRYGPVKPMNTANNGTFAAHVELKPGATVSFSVGADSEGMDWLSKLRVNTMMFLRAKAIGATLETGYTYYSQTDIAMLLNKVNPIKDGAGVSQIDFEGVIAHDSTSGTGLVWTVQNALASL